MANSFINKKADLTTTDLTTLYTVPSFKTAVIKSLIVSEGAGSGSTITITLVNETYVIKSILVTSEGTPTVTVTNNSITAIKSAALTANVTTELLTQPLVVEGGNTLTVQSSNASSFDIAVSYLNIKKEITT